jgi:CHAT domain-containing protein
MFGFSSKEVALFILFCVLTTMLFGAQQAEVSDSTKKAHDEVVALGAQVLTVCQAQDRTGCDRLLEKLLVIGEKNQLGSDEDFRKALILPLYYSPAAQKNPAIYAGRILKIFGHDLPADVTTGPACSMVARGALSSGGEAGLGQLDQIEKQYPYCKDAFGPYRSILSQAVAAQRQDYSAIEGLDTSKQAAASKIARLDREAEKAFQQGRNTEGERLFREILTIAKDNQLQDERNFVAACYKISGLIAGKDDVDKYITTYGQVLEVVGANSTMTPIICGQMYNMSRGKSEKYVEAKQRLPVCAGMFKDLDAQSAKGTAIQNAILHKDCTEAVNEGASKDDCEKMVEALKTVASAASKMQKGDFSALYPSMKKKWEESVKNGEPGEGATSMALFSMQVGEISEARKYVMQIENDPKNYEGSNDETLLGIKELRVPDGGRSGAATYSIGALYNLRIKPQDDVLKRNTLQLIFSFKNRDLEDAAKIIDLLKSNHTRSGSEIVSQLVKEYAEISNLWAQASVTCQNIPKDKEEAAVERMRILEDKLHPMNSWKLKEKDKIAPRVADVQKGLKANDALIEFAEVFLPEYHSESKPTFRLLASDLRFHYIAYVLRGDGAISGFDLGLTEETNRELEHYRTLVTSYSRDRELKLTTDERKNELLQSRQAAHRLYERLWKPLVPAINTAKNGHVYVSPDANLALLPFDALVDDADRYLVENYHISYLASGRQLVSRGGERGHGTGVDVFANPTFKDIKLAENSEETDETQCLGKYYLPLPNTQIEADDLCKTFAGQCREFTGDMAKEAELKKINGPQILHLATHGYYLNAPVSHAQDPTQSAKYRFLRSGLVFGDFDINSHKGEDGIATSLELAFLNLDHTDLVVLSACDSGISDTTPGDNLSGMRSAFHVAGARAVVSSLWKLDDETGADTMKSFYRYLSGQTGKGYTISEALRQSKLDLIRENKDQGIDLHPYYWASFVAEGDDAVIAQPKT